MFDTLTYSGQLTVVTCWCGIRHAVPVELRNEQLRHRDECLSAMELFCPLGHKYYVGGAPKSEKLERELARERQRHDQTKAELRNTENRRRAEAAAKTRIRNRVQAGVCPCCNRTFQNLASHMATKHPNNKELT